MRSIAGKMPPTPPPMDTRSLPGVERQTVQLVVGCPDDVVVRHEHVVEEHLVEVGVAGDSGAAGRTSTPGACTSITIVVIPACFGASGSVRTVASPR